MTSNGLLYVTGWTTTAEFTTIDGAYSDHSLGLTDIFLSLRRTANGNFTLKYFSCLGGSNNDLRWQST